MRWQSDAGLLTQVELRPDFRPLRRLDRLLNTVIVHERLFVSSALDPALDPPADPLLIDVAFLDDPALDPDILLAAFDAPALLLAALDPEAALL